MSFHKVRPALAAAGRIGEEPPEMAVAVDSRVAGTKNRHNFPATCRSLVVVVVVRSIVGGSVGDVVSDSVCLIENPNHGVSSFYPRLAQPFSSLSRYIASE